MRKINPTTSEEKSESGVINAIISIEKSESGRLRGSDVLSLKIWIS